MKNIALKFKYSPECEKERIKHTLDKSDWYIKNGYSNWIKLPENIKLTDIDGNKSIDILLNKAEKEYNQKDFNDVEEIVKKQWVKFSPKLEQYFEEASLVPEDFYLIELTKYGSAGSYNLPNKIIVNIQGRFGIGVSKALIHEMVHLSIQKLIDKYNVDHWVKERIVDLVLSRIIPDVATMQNIPIKTNGVDTIFNKYYPNIEGVVKNLT